MGGLLIQITYDFVAQTGVQESCPHSFIVNILIHIAHQIEDKREKKSGGRKKD